MEKRIQIHYHAPYMYDVATQLARNEQGLAAIVASATAVESLLGDIAATYSTRRDVFEEFQRFEPKNLFKDAVSSARIGVLEALSAQEISVLELLEAKDNATGKTKGKMPTLKRFYLIMGVSKGEERRSKDFNANNQRELLADEIVDLFDIRNSIVHRDGEESIVSNDATENQSGLPKSVVRLTNLKIINVPTSATHLGWLASVDNANVVEWSVGVADKFINRVLRELPIGQASDHLRRNAAPILRAK